MYKAESDPYCYPDSDVLRNRPGLTSNEALRDFEAAMTFARAAEPLPRGRLSMRHYRAIHRHLFQDVFEWAGEYRTVRLTKGESTFCYPENIAREMKQIFAWLKRNQFLKNRRRTGFAQGAAHFLAELNAIHPFREGNGRTQLVFLAVLGSQAGCPLDLGRLDRDGTIDAMIKSFKGDEAPLAAVIERLAS